MTMANDNTNEFWAIFWQQARTPRQKEKALISILKKNKSLINHHMKRVRKPKENHQDFKQYIIPSLMRTLDKFDPKSGFKFISFWTWQIKGDVSRFNKDAPLIKPRQDRITSRLDYWDESSLNATDDSGREVINLLEAPEIEAKSEAYIYTDIILRNIPEKERELIKAYYGIGSKSVPKPLREVALMIGVTRERARQILDKTRKQIKQRIYHGAIQGNTVFKEIKQFYQTPAP